MSASSLAVTKKTRNKKGEIHSKKPLDSESLIVKSEAYNRKQKKNQNRLLRSKSQRNAS